MELSGPPEDVVAPAGFAPRDAAPPPPAGVGLVEVGVAPPRLAELARALEQHGLDYEARMGVGTALVAVASDAEIRAVRGAALALGGHAVVTDAPDELRADPWGPPPPGLHLMKRLRERVRPRGDPQPEAAAVGVSNWDPSRPSPLEEDVVKCVSCGLCLPHCPTFRLTGLETASPRGRIAAMRAVEEGEATVDASFTRMMDECLACRACEAACPSGVPFGRMIEAARAQAEPTRTAQARGVRRLGLTGILPRRRLVLAAGWATAVARALRLDRFAPAAQRASMPPASLRRDAPADPRRPG